MPSPRTLIFIPTYNERDNAPELYRQIVALGLDAEILFLDDNSPDGTGRLLDELAAKDPRLHVIHRTGKLGIGSAHVDGINWAYDRGYTRLLTMDCDFTHSPADIPRLLEWADKYDVVVASRWLAPDSLPGWNALRRFLTNFGHFLTRGLLGMPYDATGAFRLYNLEKVPRAVFLAVKSRSYAFFFESLFLLTFNRFTIHEVPIVLPSRMYGHSKMDWREAVRSAIRVWRMFLAKTFRPQQFRIEFTRPAEPAAAPGQAPEAAGRADQK
jgi:dolichol-phosphate mannosyltransferase